MDRAHSGRRPHVLVLVENLSVPFDRRVWQESRALTDAGFAVTVICPTGGHQDNLREEVIDGVRILRYPLRPAAGGPIGYLREYGLALWHTLRLAFKVRRQGPIDAVHACNPPDLLFLVGLALRPFGARFVFDHHDLVPELFQARFPRSSVMLYRATRLVERLTFAAADGVISTNESYRRVAIERGKVRPDRVTVVRSAPDLSRFTQWPADDSLRRGKRYLLAYLGVMGRQDCVDYALRALKLLRDNLGREDFYCIFMGAGDSYDDMVALSKKLGVDDVVEFPGWVSDEYIQPCLSTADVCLSPDPRNPLNDVSSMNKVVEYMAMARPIVSFELTETRHSAGESAVYAPANDEMASRKRSAISSTSPHGGPRWGNSGGRAWRSSCLWDLSRQQLVTFYKNLIPDGT